MSHIAGEDNPADLGTRGHASVGDLGPGSTWQEGPEFLKRDYEHWPRTEESDTMAEDILLEESKSAGGGLVLHVSDSQERKPVRVLMEHVGTSSKLGLATTAMTQQVLTREKLEKTTQALARVLQAVIAGDQRMCAKPPSVKMVEVAVRLLLRTAAKSAIVALKNGKLRGLGAEVRDNIVWVSGRIRGDQLAELLGITSLPVVLPSEPLAASVMRKAHQEDHRRVE